MSHHIEEAAAVAVAVVDRTRRVADPEQGAAQDAVVGGGR